MDRIKNAVEQYERLAEQDIVDAQVRHRSSHTGAVFVIVDLGAGRFDALLCQTERHRVNATAFYESVDSNDVRRRRV